LRAEIEVQRAERERNQAEAQAEAITEARRYLTTLNPATDANHYLVRKGVKPVAGLLQAGADLIVPVLGADGKPMSFQRITPDGGKLFEKGCPTRGGFFAIGPKGDGGPLLLAEGLATALSCYEATDWPCLVAFNAGNLEAVARMARDRYPERRIIIAADNDQATLERTGKNTGIEAARAAAEAVGGLLAIPPAGGDFNDLAINEGPEAVKRIIENAEPIEPKQTKPIIVAADLHSFMAHAFPPREFVLSPVIPTQGLVMLYALRGIGKTMLAMFIAYCIATAQKVCRWAAPEPRKVLYIDGEMPAVTMQERFASIIQAYPIEPAPGYLKIITPDMQDRALNLATQNGQAWVEPHLDGVDFVVVDNIATLCRHGEENKTESWHPMQDWMLSLRRRGISVMVVHHSNKAGGQRGTTSREDVLDTVIALRRPPDYRGEQGARFEVHLEKARGIVGPDASPFEAQLLTDEHGCMAWACRDIEDVELETVKTLKAENPKMTVRDIAAETGFSKSKVHRLLRKAAA
jgi:putative DNA primase/helicase